MRKDVYPFKELNIADISISYFYELYTNDVSLIFSANIFVKLSGNTIYYATFTLFQFVALYI